jgi:hypothetical protein
MTVLEVRQRAPGELSVRLFVKPRASRSRILGVREGALEVAVAAPPADGAANAELVRLLARQLGLAKSALELLAGASGRSKLLAVRGIGEEELRERLLGAPNSR